MDVEDSRDWVEVLAPDGRIFYHSSTLGISSWEKPFALKSLTDKAVDSTDWREYRIWDGRSFYYNVKTGISVWAAPPEVEKNYRAVTGEAEEDMSMQPQTDSRESLNFALDTRSEVVLLLAKIFTDVEVSPDKIREILNSHEVFQHPRFQNERVKRLAIMDFMLFFDRRQVQRFRDSERVFARAMIEGLRSLTVSNLHGNESDQPLIDHSSSYETIVPWGERQAWWNSISEVRRRELFEAFVADFARCKARDEAQRDAMYMQELKSAIQSDSSTDYSADFDTEVHKKFESHAAWQALAEAQRVAVWRSCIAQHMRNVRSAISAGEALPSAARARRQAKDFVRAYLADTSAQALEGAALYDAVKEAGMNHMGPDWTNLITDKDIKGIISEYIRDSRTGRQPFSDLPGPSLV